MQCFSLDAFRTFFFVFSFEQIDLPCLGMDVCWVSPLWGLFSFSNLSGYVFYQNWDVRSRYVVGYVRIVFPLLCPFWTPGTWTLDLLSVSQGPLRLCSFDPVLFFLCGLDWTCPSDVSSSSLALSCFISILLLSPSSEFCISVIASSSSEMFI